VAEAIRRCDLVDDIYLILLPNWVGNALSNRQIKRARVGFRTHPAEQERIEAALILVNGLAMECATGRCFSAAGRSDIERRCDPLFYE